MAPREWFRGDVPATLGSVRTLIDPRGMLETAIIRPLGPRRPVRAPTLLSELRPMARPSRRHTPAHIALVLAALPGIAPADLAGQAMEETSRLAGIERVDVRAEAAWDEAITVSAGGATSDQFAEVLQQTFEASLAEAEAGPAVVDGASVAVVCHVDTYYETGLIVYSLRTQVETEGADGSPVITWIKSWVGSFTVQQLHLMFTLGEQCAESFLEDWASVN